MGFLDTIKEKIPFLKKEDSSLDNSFDFGSDQSNQNAQDPFGQADTNPNTFSPSGPGINAQNQLQPFPNSNPIDNSPNSFGFGSNTMANDSFSQNPFGDTSLSPATPSTANGLNNQDTEAMLKLIIAKLEAIEMYVKSIDARLTTIEMILRQKNNSPYY